MPTYDYECTACGHTFEAFQKITDPHMDKCPKCHKAVRRLIGSGLGIIFKGSGFYATDYRKKSGSAKDNTEACPSSPKQGCSGCPHHHPE